MGDKTTGFFEEAPGEKSSTRLYSFILLLFFILFNLLWALGDKVITIELITFDFMLLIGVFAPKYLHKMEEVKTLIGSRGPGDSDKT